MHHSVWLCWDKSVFLGWYVNFQTPVTVSSGGRLHYMDLMIDATISPDRVWAWKDLEHLDLAFAAGLITSEDERIMMDEAAGLQDRCARAVGVFSSEATTWLPREAWSAPDLPEDWGVCAHDAQSRV